MCDALVVATSAFSERNASRVRLLTCVVVVDGRLLLCKHVHICSTHAHTHAHAHTIQLLFFDGLLRDSHFNDGIHISIRGTDNSDAVYKWFTYHLCTYKNLISFRRVVAIFDCVVITTPTYKIETLLLDAIMPKTTYVTGIIENAGGLIVCYRERLQQFQIYCICVYMESPIVHTKCKCEFDCNHVGLVWWFTYYCSTPVRFCSVGFGLMCDAMRFIRLFCWNPHELPHYATLSDVADQHISNNCEYYGKQNIVFCMHLII